jgi:glycosyltransferase involved in cell wall biosynthesis
MGVELLKYQTLDEVPDTILLIGLDDDRVDIGIKQALRYKRYTKPNCQLVLRVNENDMRKGTSYMDHFLVRASEYVDGTIFVSRWLQEYFNQRSWACQNQTVIINGVDQTIFKPQPKLQNGKLNIVTHHWSDNPLKGADIYEKLDNLVGTNPDDFTFTYIGRHQCNFKNTCVVDPLQGAALAEKLAMHDVYISGSRFDPGPNHVLEALACGLPTYVHKDGGGGVDFVGGKTSGAVYESWDHLRSILLGLRGGIIPPEQPPGAIQLPSWATCVKEYNQFLETTWHKNRSGSAPF